MKNKRSIYIQLGILLFVYFVIRAYGAFFLGLSNDEAYYVTYALFPALSHFDHPPMVGFFIQLATMNLHYMGEFFVRLGPLVFTTVSLFLIYLTGKNLKNERTGLIAAYLAAASLYFSLTCGILILPDCPLVLFCLLSFYFFSKFIPYPPERAKKLDILFAFIFFGLAIYSKYQGVFLGFGVFLYILIFNRKWFKHYFMYICVLIPIFFIGLIFYWNYQHNFISFRFHENRVALSCGFRPLFFLSELRGQLYFFNPINVIVIVLAIFSFKKKKFIEPAYYWFILSCSIPLILIVMYFSLYFRTLHWWVGISYIYLFFLAAAYLDSVLKALKWPVIYVYIVLLGSLIALVILKNGWHILDSYTPKRGEQIVCGNVTRPPLQWETQVGHSVGGVLDEYGWDQVGKIYKEFISKNLQYANYPIVGCLWSMAAHMDYYVALPNNRKVLAYGCISDIRKYQLITQKRGSLKRGENALYITTSHKFIPPEKTLAKYFSKSVLLYQAPFYSGKRIVGFVFIYKMINFKKVALDRTVYKQALR